jgi:hypothetical protein
MRPAWRVSGGWLVRTVDRATSAVWTVPVLMPVASWQVEATGVAWLPDGSFIVVDSFRVIRLRASASQREEVTLPNLTLAGGQSLTVISDLRD